MNQIAYLDNAATTKLDPQVLDAMIPYLGEFYGNPSSTYSLGRQSRLAIESSRKQIAEILGVKPTTIYFTSGGTESNNTAISSAVKQLGCTHIITSPIEHHAVLHTVEHYCKDGKVTFSFVKLNASGEVDLADLEIQLADKTKAGHKCFVSLMHANNEIGVLLDIEAVGAISRRYGAIFHSDCVQTIGHYPINLSEAGVHFASASGHKFHGPKGTGILYVSEGTNFNPLIHGGSQERKKRAGTENVAGIIGFTHALALSMNNLPYDRSYISSLNKRMRMGLTSISRNITFNTDEKWLYTVLSVNFPAGSNTDLMLALMDRIGIFASGGSACSSGDDGGSHVLTALNNGHSGATIRFSFSKMTTVEDIDFALESISNILEKTSRPISA